MTINAAEPVSGKNERRKGTPSSPFQEFDNATWKALASRTPLPLTDADLATLISFGEPVDLEEVDAIYRPLTALLQMYASAIRHLAVARRSFLHEPQRPLTPYVIGIAGSVAVGKSTVARLLRTLLSRWPGTPNVDLITTDGFLFPNAELNARGLLGRKGFPESYDRRALLRFLSLVKSGQECVQAPVYSHVIYDIVPVQKQVVSRPDILIVEGLNVLQPPRLVGGSSSLAVSDFFDFSIYVDAQAAHIERWYVERFLHLRQTAFQRPDSYFRNYATLTHEQAIMQAREIWQTINLPNLYENILPTRGRADLVITKGEDHLVRRLRLRKL